MIRHFNTKTVEYNPDTGWFEVRERDCDHEYILVLFELSNGGTQLREYCKKCHHRKKGALKQADYHLGEVPRKKEEEYKKFIEAREEEDRPEFESLINWLRELKQLTYIQGYKDYINSDQWMDRRDEVLKRDNHTCQICGDEAEQVHHLTYAHFRSEYDFELVSLCRTCHQQEYHPDK